MKANTIPGRHLQMIAIGGTIGTGLFIKTGDLIAGAGPLGALIAYGIAGFAVLCVVLSFFY
jgi:amino acid permease